MPLVSSRPKVEMGPSQPEMFTITSDSGASLAAGVCSALCDEVELTKATSFTQGKTTGEVEATIDLRPCRKLPEPGTYTLVISADTGSSGGAPELLSLQVIVGEPRSCLALVGVAPTIKFVPPNAATASIKLFNRCGHTVSFDLRVSWGGDDRGIEPSISVGATSTVDAEVRLALGDAVDDLRAGRLPNDFQLVVSKAGDAGGVELVVDGEEFFVEATTAAPPPPNPPHPPQPKPAPGPAPNPDWRPDKPDGSGRLTAGRVVAWVAAGLFALTAVGALGALIDDGEESGDEETIDDSETVGSSPSTTDLAAPTTSADPSVDPGLEPTDPTGPPPPATAVVGAYLGLSVGDANDAVVADQFKSQTETVAAEGPDEHGLVVGQKPAEGERTDVGATITLLVGEYEGQVMPDVTGLSEQEAAQQLNELQREVGEDSPDYEVDLECEGPGDRTVTRQEPPAGTEVDRPFEVLLTVSAACLAVPDGILNQSLSAVTSRLDEWSVDGRTVTFLSCGDDVENPPKSSMITKIRPEPGVLAHAITITCTTLR